MSLRSNWSLPAVTIRHHHEMHAGGKLGTNERAIRGLACGGIPARMRSNKTMASLAAFNQPELARFTRIFEELFYAADPHSMTSYYTEKAHLMADGMAPVQGRGAIELFWRAAIGRANAAGAQRAIQLHEAHSSGELGYALCTVTVELPGGIRRASWDATIWQRDPAGGQWRITVDISTPLPS
jgi:ketosteroid isomerase-like protein